MGTSIERTVSCILSSPYRYKTLLQRLCRNDPPPQFIMRASEGQLFLTIWPCNPTTILQKSSLSYEETSITYLHSDYSCCGFRFKMCWKRFSTKHVYTPCPKVQVANKVLLDCGYYLGYSSRDFKNSSYAQLVDLCVTLTYLASFVLEIHARAIN